MQNSEESRKDELDGDPAALFDTVASRIHNQYFAQTHVANRSFNLLQVAYDDDHCIVWTQVPAGSRVCLIQGDLLDRLGILLNIFQRQAKRDQIDDLIDQASKSFKTLREAANEIRLGHFQFFCRDCLLIANLLNFLLELDQRFPRVPSLNSCRRGPEAKTSTVGEHGRGAVGVALVFTQV